MADELDEDIKKRKQRWIESELEAIGKTEAIKVAERLYNLYDRDNTTTKKYYIDTENPDKVGKAGMKKEKPFNGVEYDVPDYEKLFKKNPVGKDANILIPEKFNIKTKGTDYGETRIKNHDVFFSKDDYDNGFLTKDQMDALGGDFGQYVPFFFEDLRKPDRRIYFRAFLTNFKESINPSWSKDNYYGRIDPVSIYKSTSRTFSIGFVIASFSPAGYKTMWMKVNHLSKMMYPTYNANSVMSKSPVIRVRIGDVMSQEDGQGLPGYIDGEFGFDYSNSPWEITPLNPNSTIPLGSGPMIIQCSFTFQVIHERNPGLSEGYSFDTSIFRSIGQIPFESDEGVNNSERNPSSEVEDSTIQDGGNSHEVEGVE